MKQKIKTASIYLIFILLLLSCSDKEIIIGLKENIHHDDFEYSVQNVEIAEFISNVKSTGKFYIVTFRVENNAKRVDHKWDNDIAFIIDEKGKIYKNSYEMQINLKVSKDFPLKEKYVTPAGKDEETMLVFDIPNDVKEPYLKVSGSFLMGDFFDGFQFKNTKTKLF